MNEIKKAWLEEIIVSHKAIGEKEELLYIEAINRRIKKIRKRTQELLIKEELKEKILYKIKYYKGTPQESYDYFYNFPIWNINNPDSIIWFEIEGKKSQKLLSISWIKLYWDIYRKTIFMEWISIITWIKRKIICLNIEKQNLDNSYIWNWEEFEKVDFSLSDKNVRNEYKNIIEKIIKFKPGAKNPTAQKAYNYLKYLSEVEILNLEIDWIKIFETILVSESDVKDLAIKIIFLKWLNSIFEGKNVSIDEI